MSLSASKVEIAWKCEGSQAYPQRDEVHPGQEDGTERHDERDKAIKSGNPPEILTARWPGYTWRAEVALVFDVATGKGWEIGQSIGRRYGDLGPFCIPGTADAIGRGPAGDLVVLDWKSFDPNVSRAAVNAQLHTLALAACRAYGLDTCEVAISHEVRPLDVAALDLFDLETFAGELRIVLDRAAAARRLVREGIKPALTTGTHCRWCSAFNDCDAQRALAIDVRSGAADLRVAEMLPLDDDESAAKAYEFLKRIKMLTARLSSAVYARAGERPIPLGDGRWLGKVAKLGDRQIDGDKAYEAVRAKYGQDVADKAVTRKASQKGIEDALRPIAGKGKLSAMKDALMKELELAGAVTRKPGEAIEEFQGQLKAVNE